MGEVHFVPFTFLVLIAYAFVHISCKVAVDLLLYCLFTIHAALMLSSFDLP